jgi:prevent-host-death family protein
MPSVNMHEAKTNLSKLVEAVVSGAEQEITISRNGIPAVKLVPATPTPRKKFGFASGRFTFDHEASDRLDAEVQRLFEEGADPTGERLR